MTAGDDRETRPSSPGDDQDRGGGLSWTWSLDFEAMLAALAEPAPWDGSAAGGLGSGVVGSGLVSADSPEADLPEVLRDAPALPLGVIAGRIAEALPTGPGLAGWLATSSAKDLQDGALAGMAASYRRLASWAQAGELAVIAELASRSAAADDKIGVDEDGRPLRVADEACAQVSLALTMSHTSAAWWSDLGVTLGWRLAATGEALRSGQIDLTRARLIAEATVTLDEEKARAVEARVLPGAGDQTTGQLRAALRRAVILADPDGAERRRKEAELRAQVTLYPDAEGTASLAGHNLSGVGAAAAMARITSLARALKASGADGGIDLLRAQVFLGLLLGTLPYLPPAADVPPDGPPDDPAGGRPGTPPSGDPQEGEPRRRSSPHGRPGRGVTAAGSRPDERPPRQGGDAGRGPGSRAGPRGPRPASPVPPAATGPGSRGSPGPGEPEPGGGGSPPKADEDRAGPDSSPGWPEVLSFLPPGPASMGGLSPAGGGLLGLRVPWVTLMGASEPGQVTRLGPVTPAQARHLADLAIASAAAGWRVIVTGPGGRALAVARVPRRPWSGATSPSSPSPASPASSVQGPGLIGHVTVTVSKDALAGQVRGGQLSECGLPEILVRVWRTALRAAEAAELEVAADAAAGGCAHGSASAGYRPAPGLRAYVAARDLTCRFPTCRQPAHRCDLDHTTPFNEGGRTCRCNLGGLCRFHHQIKQHLLWRLAQATPGVFAWTTPAGRTYTTGPDAHAA